MFFEPEVDKNFLSGKTDGVCQLHKWLKFIDANMKTNENNVFSEGSFVLKSAVQLWRGFVAHFHIPYRYSAMVCRSFYC